MSFLINESAERENQETVSPQNSLDEKDLEKAINSSKKLKF